MIGNIVFELNVSRQRKQIKYIDFFIFQDN